MSLSNVAPGVEEQSEEVYILPASFSQERLWFIDLLEPGSPVYNIPTALRLQGNLDIPALEKSLADLVNRHESLRTAFDAEDGRPVQVIIPQLEFNLPLLDLSGLPAEQREAEARRRLEEESRRPFDLAHSPLFRAILIRLAPQEHIFFTAIHHIVSDGWSMGVIYRELALLYRGYTTGAAPVLPELAIQYADFASWQRDFLKDDRLKSQLAYWKQQLSDIPSLLELPTDFPRPPAQSFRGARVQQMLPSRLHRALAGLSQRSGATMFMTTLAAFQALLYRYARQETIVVGTPIAGRNRPELESLVGFFINTLVMRGDLADQLTFRQLLAKARKTALEAYANQDVPYERLVEELRPERELSYNPVFQVMFVYQNAPMTAPELHGLTIAGEDLEIATAKFDLTMELMEQGDGLRCVVEYRTDLFRAETIEALLGHYQNLLEQVCQDPDRQIGEIALLNQAERQKILYTWNDTARPGLQGLAYHQIFERTAARIPDALAVAYQDTRWSYRQLNERANQLAHFLRRLGVGPEVKVGICLERSVEMALAVLGILKAGGAYIPLDPAYPKDRLAYMLEDSQAPVLLTQASLLDHLPRHSAQVTCLDRDWRQVAGESTQNPDVPLGLDHLAYVIYTSGSTGKPKGVMVTHRGVENLATALAEQFAILPDSRILQFSSFSFDATVAEMAPIYLQGASLHFAPREALMPGPELARLMQQQGITVVTMPPSALAVMSPQDFPTLKSVVTAGEACTQDVVARWAPGRRLVNGYGPTETTVCATTAVLSDPQRLPPIGRPLQNIQVYILDASYEPTPVGVPGELCIGGISLARGYLNRPDLTAEKFIPDPFSQDPGARLYCTGDLVRYLPDSNIEYLGRIDQQVKIRGFRIELGEIESVIASHPQVRDALVLARQDPGGNKRLVGYVIPQNHSLAVNELRQFVKERLPDYMTPAAWVLLEAFPLTPNGKVDRKALPEPEMAPGEGERVHQPPRDSVERKLVQIWEKLLAVQPIGIKENFFEIGGHSLLAVQLFTQVEREFGKNLPLAVLYQAPTIEQLAEILRKEGWTPAWTSLVEMQPGGGQAPLFFVHGVGGDVLTFYRLGRYLSADQPLYGLRARGLDGKTMPLEQVEAMAEAYLQEIQTLQPHGPYFLSGYSYGGLVAYEIACKLHQKGEPVALVAIIEAASPTFVARATPAQVQNWEALSSRVQRHQESLDWSKPRQSLGYIRLKARNRYNDLTRKARRRVGVGVRRFKRWWKRSLTQLYRRAGVPLPRTLRHFSVEEINRKAGEIYRPRPYPGQVVLFRREMETPDPSLGWGQLAAGVEIKSLPGNITHLELLDEGIQVQVLAESLQKAVDAARTP